MKKGFNRPAILQLILLLLPVLFTASGFCQDEPQNIELTRNAAIGMAIHNNIDLRVRALDSSLAETQVEGSKAIYNPTLSASFDASQTKAAGKTYGTRTTSGAMGVSQRLSTGGTVSLTARTGPISAVSDPLYDYTDWASAVGVTIYQPLLKNAGREATELGISQSKLSHESSLERFRDDVNDKVFAVISNYNRLYVLRQLLETREDALTTARQLLEELKAKSDRDEKFEVEQSNAEYALSQRKTEFIEAERQVHSQEATLLYLIGESRNIHIVPVDPPSRDEPQETEVEAIEIALAQRPDLKDLRVQLKANELRERVSKRNLMPDLALVGSAGYRGYEEDGSFSDTVSQIGDGKGEYWSAGLRLSFPIGNDLAKSEYRYNRIRSEQLKKQIDAAEWKVRDLIEDDNRSLLSARLRLQSTAKSRELAEQRVEQYRKSRRLGKASVKDFLDAENDLIYARNLELRAVESFAYLVAQLWRDIGVLLERQNIQINSDRPEEVTSGNAPLVQPLKTVRHQEQEPGATTGSEKITEPQAASQEVTGATPTGTDRAMTASGPASPPQVSEGELPRELDAKSYTLKIGEFPKALLASVKREVEQAGLVPVVTQEEKRPWPVTRLLVGEYKDKASAQQALQELKTRIDTGFLLRNGIGTFDLFAGSFFDPQAAEVERKRLAAIGLTLDLRDVTVDLPTVVVTAGSFTARQTAQLQVEKLDRSGFNVEITESKS